MIITLSRRLDTMSISVNLPSSQLITSVQHAKPIFYIIITITIIKIVVGITILIVLVINIITIARPIVFLNHSELSFNHVSQNVKSRQSQ